MLRMLWTSAAIACLSCTISAQTPTPLPAFTVADVHPSPHRINPEVRGGLLKDGLYILRDATMVDLITRAYKVDPGNVQGGPSWIEFDRYDIFAGPRRHTAGRSLTYATPVGMEARTEAVAACDRARICGRFVVR